VAALFANSKGADNTAMGANALDSNTSGSNNIGLGFNAGLNLTTGNNKIDVGNHGMAGESNTIRIGTQGTQTATFISGISGAVVTGGDVVVSSAGRLGVVMVVPLDMSDLKSPWCVKGKMSEHNVCRDRFDGLAACYYYGCATRGSRMTWLAVALLGALMFGPRPVRAQAPPTKSIPIATPGPSRWIAFFDSSNKKHNTVRAGSLVFMEKFDRSRVHGEIHEGGDFVGGDYEGGYQYFVQRDGEARRPLFRSMRGASLEMGHRGRLVLIYSSCATQCEEVYVADVEKGNSWRVDAQAMQAYERNLKPDPRLTISPYPIDFSPDDKEVLLSVQVEYIQKPSKERAGKIGTSFKKAWYAVDSGCGSVVRQYFSDPSGQNWWAR